MRTKNTIDFERMQELTEAIKDAINGRGFVITRIMIDDQQEREDFEPEIIISFNQITMKLVGEVAP